MRRLDPYYLILLAFAGLVVAPLTAPGYFVLAHDARHTIYFMQMFDAALREGALYPRWATDMTFGYGYPLWLIIAPLPYYAAEFFHLVGLDFVSAVKAVEAVGLIASGTGMFLFVRRVFGREAGLLAGVVYLFVPYHIVDLYVRAAFGEFLTFVFPPFILWALYLLITTRRMLYLPLVALFYGGLVLTHVQMAVLLSPVIGLYILSLVWLDARRRPNALREMAASLATAAAGIVWGVAAAAAFLLPVVMEQRYLTSDPLIGGFFDFRQHFISLAQLLSPFWGYGYAGINGGDQFSLQLGIIPLLLSAVSLFLLGRGSSEVTRLHVGLFFIVALAAVLLMLPISTPIWGLAAPVVAFVQFPWRLLIIAALALAVLAGTALLLAPESDRPRGAILLALLSALALFPFAHPQYSDAVFTANSLMDFEVKDRELLGDTIWMAPGQRPKDSPLVAQYRAGAITEKAVAVEGNAVVTLVSHRSQSDEVSVAASGPARIMFYTHYFPGWTATVNGQPADDMAPYGEQGLISVAVPDGQSTVRVQFGDTWPRQLGGAISLLALAAALGFLFRLSVTAQAAPEARPAELVAAP